MWDRFEIGYGRGISRHFVFRFVVAPNGRRTSDSPMTSVVMFNVRSGLSSCVLRFEQKQPAARRSHAPVTGCAHHPLGDSRTLVFSPRPRGWRCDVAVRGGSPFTRCHDSHRLPVRLPCSSFACAAAAAARPSTPTAAHRLLTAMKSKRWPSSRVCRHANLPSSSAVRWRLTRTRYATAAEHIFEYISPVTVLPCGRWVVHSGNQIYSPWSLLLLPSPEPLLATIRMPLSYPTIPYSFFAYLMN